MLSPVTPRPTAASCHLHHCQSLISSLCFRSRVSSEHQSSWLPRWSAMTLSALAQVISYKPHYFAIYIYSFARISKIYALQTCGPWASSATSYCPDTPPSWATTTRRPTTISASKSNRVPLFLNRYFWKTT